MVAIHIHTVGGASDAIGSVVGALADCGLDPSADREAIVADPVPDGTVGGHSFEDGRVQLTLVECSGEWLTFSVDDSEELAVTPWLTRTVTELVGEANLDWAVVSEERPTGSPGTETVGPVVAMSEGAFHRVCGGGIQDAPTLATAFHPEIRIWNAVGFLTAFGDSSAVGAVTDFLEDPESVDHPLSGQIGGLDPFVDMTRPSDPGTRVEGVESLIYSEGSLSPGTLSAYTAVLAGIAEQDPDPQVRMAALSEISSVYDGTLHADEMDRIYGVETVFRLAREDPDPGVRKNAVRLVGTFGTLLDGLDDGPARERLAESWDTPRAYELYRDVYTTDEDPDVRGAALRSLGGYGQYEAVIDALTAPEPELREAANWVVTGAVSLAGSAEDMSDNLVEAVNENADLVREAMESDDPEVRAAGLRLSIALEGNTPKDIVEYIDDEGKMVRRGVVVALRNVEDPDEQVVDALLQACDDDDRGVSDRAYETIETLYEGRELPEQLRAELLDTLTESGAKYAALTLAKTRDPDLLDPLLERCRADEPSWAPVAAAQLADRLDDDARDRVAAVLIEELEDAGLQRDGPGNITKPLAKGVGDLEHPEAATALADRLEAIPREESDSSRRKTVAIHLARSGCEAVLPTLVDEIEGGTRGLYMGVAEYGEGAAGPLLDRLEDADGDERTRILQNLGATGAPAALRPVVEALTDADDRTAADLLDGLKLSGDDRAIPVLRHVADRTASSRVRRRAESGLENLGAD